MKRTGHKSKLYVVCLPKKSPRQRGIPAPQPAVRSLPPFTESVKMRPTSVRSDNPFSFRYGSPFDVSTVLSLRRVHYAPTVGEGPTFSKQLEAAGVAKISGNAFDASVAPKPPAPLAESAQIRLTSAKPLQSSAASAGPASAAEQPTANQQATTADAGFRDAGPRLDHSSVDADILQLGCRVQTAYGDLGVIRYRGETHFRQGLWIGVELDRPKGKNDG